MEHHPSQQHMNTAPTGDEQSREVRPKGPMIGAVIIILLLILGALYFWGSELNKQDGELPLILGDESARTSSDTSPDAIEDDFNDTDVTQLETDVNAEMTAAENEF